MTVGVSSNVAALAPQFRAMYADHAVVETPGIDDSVVAVRYASALRRVVAPTVQGFVDGRIAFLPVRAGAALVMLESCLNWAVIGSGPDCLMVHAAALERHGRAVILPAQSGSGKSTLTAAMVARGWRLLSDETAVFRTTDHHILPLARPISLKNASIALARDAFGADRLSETFHGMPKGDLAYLRPPAEAVARMEDAARPAHIVSPRYVAGEALTVQPLSRCQAFRLLVDNAVNYTAMMRSGFDVVRHLVEHCSAASVRYGDLDQVLGFLDRLDQHA